MSNLKFYEAVLRDELPISKEWADKGWPPLLYPWFLACAQLPDADEPAKRAFTLAMGDSIKAGVLPAERKRIPWFIERDITEPHVSRSDFAIWLHAQRMEPSPLVREWIEGQWVGGAPVVATADPDEKPLSTNERNTLLVIIAALCSEAKIDYTKPAKAAGMILHTADSMGLKIGETTIERHLKKIPDALEARMK